MGVSLLKEKRKGSLIVNDFSSIYEGLAFEDSICRAFDNSTNLVLILWTVPPSVVIGRRQELLEEVNVEFCKLKKINIARRLSSGGAVYQDRGNINISLIFPRTLLSPTLKLGDLVQSQTQLIVNSLEALQISELEIESQGNIHWKKKKISGSANRILKNCILHHATLLMGVNLNNLYDSLLVRSNSLDSNKSRFFPCINLGDEFNVQLWKKQLKKELIQWFDLSTLTEEAGTIIKNSELELEYRNSAWIQSGRRKNIL